MKLNGKPVLNIGINKTGIDYICGDLHGCLDMLMQKLSDIGFDTSKDRLFAVGDIIDRGPGSLKCIELLNTPWFYSVRGNHEQAAIDYSRGQITPYEYIGYGGAWFCYLDKGEQIYIAEQLDKLPWAIQLKTANGVIGIVHSQPVKIEGKYNWKRFVKAIKDDEHLRGFNSVRDLCTWERLIVQDEDELKGCVTGVLAVVAGHTPVPKPWVKYNFYNIDTGACFDYDAEEEGYGYLTVLRADTLNFI